MVEFVVVADGAAILPVFVALCAVLHNFALLKYIRRRAVVDEDEVDVVFVVASVSEPLEFVDGLAARSEIIALRFVRSKFLLVKCSLASLLVFIRDVVLLSIFMADVFVGDDDDVVALFNETCA